MQLEPLDPAGPVIAAYSRCADEYDTPENLQSCWGEVSTRLWDKLAIKPDHRLVVDVGCGTGGTLAHLARRCGPATELVGVEPADNMRERGRSRTSPFPNVSIVDGRFEALPFASGAVDYLYSIMAFHWVTNLHQATRELARVLHSKSEMDLFFIGRWNGREFIRATTPVFLRYMGAARWLTAATLRQQLEAPAALDLFRRTFPTREVTLQESYETYYDTLDGHLAWWVRIEGQLVGVPDAIRDQCERDVRAALQKLALFDRIPYTIHLLHVTLRA